MSRGVLPRRVSPRAVPREPRAVAPTRFARFRALRGRRETKGVSPRVAPLAPRAVAIAGGPPDPAAPAPIYYVMLLYIISYNNILYHIIAYSVIL